MIGGGVAPGSPRAWVDAARPKTLTAALTPVLVGTACAFDAGAFRAGPAVAALVGALLLQIGSNLANDLYDFEKGADREGRLGPTRVTQAGLLTPRQVRTGMWIVFGAATVAGIYLTAVAGWIIVAIGVASVGAAILYTGGPWPLGYHGLGDLFVFLFFGLAAVCGTAFVQARFVPPLAWWAAVPIGTLATAILVVNNTRDWETDRRAGKGTIPARLGQDAGRVEYTALLVAAYAVPAALVVTGRALGWVLLPFVTLPRAILEIKTIWAATTGAEWNGSLHRTARLLFFYGLVLGAGIVLGRILGPSSGGSP